MILTNLQKNAIHFFDERGHSLLSQRHLEERNRQLVAENARLRELLARVQRIRKDNKDSEGDLA